ncbi:relaxin receptor 1-like [Gigantopelta aegis]|uniref:relaxin receptor 1-like n=1 Tax=Gigantopelta aegis TaxID=1735272 RepID=UPI001B888537|nr:relaxin receptor 1-like [Gigantopelta aegis]
MNFDKIVCQRRRLNLSENTATAPRKTTVSSRRFYWCYVIVMCSFILSAVILCVFLTSTSGSETPMADCPKDTFSCQIDKICINKTLLCDGRPDCPDASDERVPCDTELYKMFDSRFKKRKGEDKNGNCSLVSTPKKCRCLKGTELYCDFGQENEKPAVGFFNNIPGDVTSLTVVSLNITTLSEANFTNMPFLTELEIKYSELRIIHPGTFRRCPLLTKVDFTDNKLKHISSDIFPVTNNIQELILINNQLNTLKTSDLRNLRKLTKLSLENNLITTIEDGAFKWTQLQELTLYRNRITNIQKNVFTNMENLRRLHLNENRISVIQPGSFKNLTNLHILILARNELVALQSGVFEGLHNLSLLDLSRSHIQEIKADVFEPLHNVESLILKENPINRFPSDSFTQLTNLKYAYFDKFYLCAYVPQAQCEPYGDGISSQKNLLENVILRVSVWIMAVLGCIGNLVVLLGRCILKEDNQIHSFFIKNLSLADMLMGIYLFIIGSRDQMYHGNYLEYDETWRKSWECDVSGIISTVSSEMSVLTLTVITLDRYLCIMYPLSFRKRGIKMAYFIMGVMWLIAIMLGVIPILGLDYFGSSFYKDNGMCIPLHLHDPHAKGWQYSAVLFLGVNFVSFAFIAFAYTAMFLSIQRSEINLRTTRESKETCLVKRFFFIVSTDFLCWIPIIIIKIAALSGAEISDDLYAWVIVFILPVNSALNPLLYTLTTKLFRQKLFSKFVSVVWGPRSSNGKDLTNTTSSTRARSTISRQALNDVELEHLGNHCDKAAVKLLKETSPSLGKRPERPISPHTTPYNFEHLYPNWTPSNTKSNV